MLLSALVEGVARVRATSRKLEKVALLADLLRQARGREAELAPLYLTGTLPQGRIGLGWRTLQPAMTEAAAEGEPLDPARRGSGLRCHRGRARGGVRRTEGPRLARAVRPRGSRTSAASWSSCSWASCARARWKASSTDAIARAAGLPPADVRQAAMYSGNLGEVARCRAGGGRGRAVALLAAPALSRRAHAGQPRGRRRGRAGPAGPGRLRVQARRRAHPAAQGRATRCGSSRATCRTSPRACPRSWSGRVACPRASW